MLSQELCIVQLEAPSAEAVIRALARCLHAKGHVHDSFESAACSREKRSPTGLPFVPIPVALPHAEPEHVKAPAIALATLARPVKFRQMGSPGITLEVALVVMPALTAKEQAQAELSRVIERLQSEVLRRGLVAAGTQEELLAALALGWKGV
jgi:PTS system galactitol-specific IIA component